MTKETVAELVARWNSGWGAPPTEPNMTTLDRLRAEWATASEQERAIFKD
jgi:hypothetical protein